MPVAETLEPSEVYATVNEYTRSVSEILEQRDGAVVEFNGDGLMAVCGALRSGGGKEAGGDHRSRSRA